VEHADNKEGVKVCDLTSRTDAVAEGGHVGEQDQTLFIHGLVKGEMTHLESIIAPAQNTISPAWATWAPSRRPERLMRRALPAHHA
jgi:hypothetical protein